MLYLRKVKNYKNINDPQRSFVSAYIEKHVEKHPFFHEIQSIIDWDPLDEELRKVYTKGLTDLGAKAYAPLLLFKMVLISHWYNLSDTQTEAMVNDSLSAMRFCDLTIEDSVPSHSTLSRFKKALKEKRSYKRMLAQFETQLDDKGLRVLPGKAGIDARIKKTPKRPKP